MRVGVKGEAPAIACDLLPHYSVSASATPPILPSCSLHPIPPPPPPPANMSHYLRRPRHCHASIHSHRCWLSIIPHSRASRQLITRYPKHDHYHHNVLGTSPSRLLITHRGMISSVELIRLVGLSQQCVLGLLPYRPTPRTSLPPSTSCR